MALVVFFSLQVLFNAGGTLKLRQIKDGEHQRVFKAISSGQCKENIQLCNERTNRLHD